MNEWQETKHPNIAPVNPSHRLLANSWTLQTPALKVIISPAPVTPQHAPRRCCNEDVEWGNCKVNTRVENIMLLLVLLIGAILGTWTNLTLTRKIFIPGLHLLFKEKTTTSCSWISGWLLSLTASWCVCASGCPWACYLQVKSRTRCVQALGIFARLQLVNGSIMGIYAGF